MQYLNDYADVLRRDHLARWESDAEHQSIEDQSKGRVNTLVEITTLEFGHISAFYQSPSDEEDDDESQTTETENR